MGEVLEVNGPIVIVRLPNVVIGEQVRVGRLGLVGEVIGRSEDCATVQVYEMTDGLRPGEQAEALGHPLSVELGPGLLGGIFDGVQRPLTVIQALEGDRIARGLQIPSLDRKREWPFEPSAGLAIGADVKGGMVLGYVPETPSINHKILMPPGMHGTLIDLAPPGSYTVEQTVARVHESHGPVHKLALFHRWPVRVPRPYLRRNPAIEPLITGQRVLDTFFPVVKGGKAAIPGPFGGGKTVLQHQIARWCNAQIVIYVGCGERGNELVDVLESMPSELCWNLGDAVIRRRSVLACW